MYYWKALNKSYNFASDRTSIQGLLAKLWGSKAAGVPTGEISGVTTPLWPSVGVKPNTPKVGDLESSGLSNV